MGHPVFIIYSYVPEIRRSFFCAEFLKKISKFFYRLPYDVINFEMDLMTDIGVKVKTKRFLGTADLTLTKLKDEMNCQAVFLGLGNPEPKVIPMFKDLTEQQGFYTSKGFLPKVRLPYSQENLKKSRLKKTREIK